MMPPEKDAGKPADGGSANVSQAEKPQTRRYTPEELLSDARAIVGYPTHVLAGALHDDDRKELTADSARSLCEKWLKKPVETEDEEDEQLEDEE